MDTPPIVTQVRQSTTQLQNGAFAAVYTVQFNVGKQGPFIVQIPAAEFTAAEVKKRTESFAAELAQIPMVEG
jgi:hypothetical protein